jgi:hypothetical protein
MGGSALTLGARILSGLTVKLKTELQIGRHFEPGAPRPNPWRPHRGRPVKAPGQAFKIKC